MDDNDERDILEEIMAESLDTATQRQEDLTTIRECSASQEGGSTTTEFIHPRFMRNSKQPSVVSYDKNSTRK